MSSSQNVIKMIDVDMVNSSIDLLATNSSKNMSSVDIQGTDKNGIF